MRLLFVLALVCCCAAMARGQTSQVVSPTPLAEDVSRTISTVTAVFSDTIDHSSVFLRRKMFGYVDSALVDHFVDSLGIVLADTMPCVYVLAKSVYDTDSTNVDRYRRLALLGKSTVVDDTSIVFTLVQDQLQYDTWYTIVVDDARVVTWNGSGYDTTSVPKSVTHFKTEARPHYVVAAELGANGLVSCGDTLKLTYNRKLPDTENGSGSLVYLIRPTTATEVDSALIEWSCDTIPCSLSLSPDSMSVLIPTDSILGSTVYLLISNHRIFTGDDADTALFSVRRFTHGAMHFTAVGFDTNVTIPADYVKFRGDQAHTILAGDTVQFTAPQFIGHTFFSHWLCTEDQTIDSVTFRVFSKVYACSTLASFNVKAVYKNVSKDTFAVTVTGSSYGSVKVLGFADSLGSGVYTAWRMPNSGVSFIAQSLTTGKFNAWSAPTMGAIHASTSPIVVYATIPGWATTGGYFNIGGDFGPISGGPTCPPYKVTLNVMGHTYNWDTPRIPVDPTDVGFETGVVLGHLYDYQDRGTYQSTPPIVNHLIGFTVTDDCYAIQCVTLDGRLIAGNDNYNDPWLGQTWSTLANVDGSPCEKTYTVHLRHKTYKLLMEMEGLDGSVVLRDGQDIHRDITGLERREKWQGETVLSTYDFWDNVIEYKCDEEVTLTPILDKSQKRLASKSIYAWSTNTGYTWGLGDLIGGAIIDVPNKKLKFTMDRDRKVRLAFVEDGFYAMKLKMLTVNPDDERAESGPIDWSFDLNEDGRVVDLVRLGYAQIEFEGADENRCVRPIIEFNLAVKESSIQHSSGNVGLWAKDYKFGRADRHDFHSYIAVDRPNSNQGEIFCIAEDNLAAWSCGTLRVEWGADIESTADLPLLNPNFTTFLIAPPKVKLKIDKIEVLDETEWDRQYWLLIWVIPYFFENDPDVHMVSTTGMVSRSLHGKMVIENGTPDEEGEHEGMGEGEPKYPDRVIGNAAGFRPTTGNGSMLFTADVLDNDPAFAYLTAYLASLAEKTEGVDIDSAGDLAAYITLGIEAASAALADVLTEAAKPEYMGTYLPEFGSHDFARDVWGGMPDDPTTSMTKQRSYTTPSVLTDAVFRIEYTIILETR